jgi:hypothetical protein
MEQAIKKVKEAGNKKKKDELSGRRTVSGMGGLGWVWGDEQVLEAFQSAPEKAGAGTDAGEGRGGRQE